MYYDGSNQGRLIKHSSLRLSYVLNQPCFESIIIHDQFIVIPTVYNIGIYHVILYYNIYFGLSKTGCATPNYKSDTPETLRNNYD